jgi:hypothetical protein
MRILGNPPFIGKQYQIAMQKEDLEFVAGKVKGAGVLDFVAGWYLKAAQYLSGTKEGFVSRDKGQFLDVQFEGKGAKPSKRKQPGGIEDIFVAFGREDAAARRRVRCAFVSTNSITQGEQVGVLWSELLARGMKIRFAHRTFKWSNEAPGKAAVHCVIVGFGLEDAPHKRLFDYIEVDGPPHELTADNINPYLVDAPDVLISSRKQPVSNVPEVNYGSFALDDGNFTISDEERIAILREDPDAASFLRPFVGGHELLHGQQRWCVWLRDAELSQISKSAPILQRVRAVKEWRQASGRPTTKKLADTPTQFAEVRQPTSTYLAIPTVSSEKRRFIPSALLSAEVIASNQVYVLPDATPYHFGVLGSTMHMAWIRHVCGRLESRYRYSAQIVYNNFPWPQALTDAQRSAIETAAQGVLDARAAHPGSTLAQLYDPDTMPPNLVKAHQALDRAVDAAYRADGGPRGYAGDAERVAFLFRRYAQLTSLV